MEELGEYAVPVVMQLRRPQHFRSRLGSPLHSGRRGGSGRLTENPLINPDHWKCYSHIDSVNRVGGLAVGWRVRARCVRAIVK